MDDAQEQYLRSQVKRELRTSMKAVRNATPQVARAARSTKVCAGVRALPEWQDASRVMAFMPIGSEVDIIELIEEAAQSKTVALPRVDLETNEITVHAYQGLASLIEGPYGVMEPLATSPQIDPNTLSAILVPGLAADPRGHRIGYGAGYYDRFLAKVPSTPSIIVCFDFQLISECPNQASDVVADIVVSDIRTLRI